MAPLTRPKYYALIAILALMLLLQTAAFAEAGESTSGNKRRRRRRRRRASAKTNMDERDAGDAGSGESGSGDGSSIDDDNRLTTMLTGYALVFALVHLTGFTVVYIMKCVKCLCCGGCRRRSTVDAPADLTQEEEDNKKRK